MITIINDDAKVTIKKRCTDRHFLVHVYEYSKEISLSTHPTNNDHSYKD